MPANFGIQKNGGGTKDDSLDSGFYSKGISFGARRSDMLKEES